MADPSDIRKALYDVRAFIVYRLELRADDKTDKVPTSPLTGGNINPHDSQEWMLPDEAALWAEQLNDQHDTTAYGTGVIISEDVVLPNGRRLFALDIDKCRDGAMWAPHAHNFCSKLAGGGVEVSVSGNGLHVFGTYSGVRPDHGTRNKTYGLELYSRLRFIACTGAGANGDPLKDLTKELHALIEYFPPHEDIEYGEDLTEAPVPQWSGPKNDDELIRRMLRHVSAKAAIGRSASFADLWFANETKLAAVFPPQQNGAYDASAADQALANHLAWGTGSHGERVLALMERSALARDKWNRPGYLHNTIQRACSSQTQWYQGLSDDVTVTLTPSEMSVTLPLSSCTPALVGAELLPAVATDDSKPEHSTPLAFPTDANSVIPPGTRPRIGDLLLLNQQVALFHDCTYVQDIHQVLMPQGHLLSSERFDIEFSGYQGFIVTVDGQRPAKKAWDAFIFSEIHAFPKVKGLFFDPRQPPKAVVHKEGMSLINSYVPPIIARKQGDVSPFLTHLYKLLPNGQDALILLAYFAACVQYAGQKFQWWPLIQGVEGNGKTTLSYLLEYAVGERYTHWPKAAELGSKFNSAFYGKLLICCEDVYISEARGSLWETLKPMITGAKLEIEAKGVDKVTREVCFNGVMNSNHKNAIRKTKNDRRVGPFFCAQQAKDDLLRDGMTVDYFRKLRSWRLGEGKEIVADYLLRYEIPDELNPATSSIVCPVTTATQEAVNAGFGVAEQEVLEAIASGAQGFKGGWISSSALDRLLGSIGKAGAIPRNKRREMLETLGYMPHLHLPEGRMTSNDTDGSRPYLFVLPVTLGASETDTRMIGEMYQQAQR